MINGLMFKHGDKNSKEHMKTACEEVKRPENCTSLSNARVDELIWNRLQANTRSLDCRFQEVQLYLLKGVTVIVKQLNELLEKDVDPKDIIKNLMKSIEFFSHSNYELNVRRRECLKKDIDSETYLGLFSQSVPINEYLFGGELQKRLDEIEKSNKVVNKVVPGKFKRGFGRGRRFRYQPYRYTGSTPATEEVF